MHACIHYFCFEVIKDFLYVSPTAQHGVKTLSKHHGYQLDFRSLRYFSIRRQPPVIVEFLESQRHWQNNVSFRTYIRCFALIRCLVFTIFTRGSPRPPKSSQTDQERMNEMNKYGCSRQSTTSVCVGRFIRLLS